MNGVMSRGYCTSTNSSMPIDSLSSPSPQDRAPDRRHPAYGLHARLSGGERQSRAPMQRGRVVKSFPIDGTRGTDKLYFNTHLGRVAILPDVAFRVKDTKPLTNQPCYFKLSVTYIIYIHTHICKSVKHGWSTKLELNIWPILFSKNTKYIATYKSLL